MRFFTATSAVCVTGLTGVNTGSFFSRSGQNVNPVLIQIGGLGILTFTSLVFYCIRNGFSLTDRIALGQAILHDKTFDMGRVLKAIVIWTLIIETCGAVFIFYAQRPSLFKN